MRSNVGGNWDQITDCVLPVELYKNSATNVARLLIGKLLVRRYQDQIMGGLITETEAYQGEEDQGCHAKAGLTPRTKVMYGPAGHAYVYFTYGMHWMLNIVTNPVGFPAAVLIRGIKPVIGLDLINSLRPSPHLHGSQPNEKGWTDGPAKLCQALSINGSLNGLDLCNTNSDLWLAESGLIVPGREITNSPRIGLNNVPEPWKSIPWRYQWKTKN